MPEYFKLDSGLLGAMARPPTPHTVKDSTGAFTSGIQRGVSLGMQFQQNNRANQASARAEAAAAREQELYEYKASRRDEEELAFEEAEARKRTEEERKAADELREQAEEERKKWEHREKVAMSGTVRRTAEAEAKRARLLLEEADITLRARKREEEKILENDKGLEAVKDAKAFIGAMPETGHARNMNIVASINTLSRRLTTEQQIELLDEYITEPKTEEEAGALKANMVNELFIALKEGNIGLANDLGTKAFGGSRGIKAYKITEGASTISQSDDIITMYAENEKGELVDVGTVPRYEYLSKLNGGRDIIQADVNRERTQQNADNVDKNIRAKNAGKEFDEGNKAAWKTVEAATADVSEDDLIDAHDALRQISPELLAAYKKQEAGTLKAKLSTIYRNALVVVNQTRGETTLTEALRQAAYAQQAVDEAGSRDMADYLLGRHKIKESGAAPVPDHDEVEPKVRDTTGGGTTPRKRARGQMGRNPREAVTQTVRIDGVEMKALSYDNGKTFELEDGRKFNANGEFIE